MGHRMDIIKRSGGDPSTIDDTTNDAPVQVDSSASNALKWRAGSSQTGTVYTAVELTATQTLTNKTLTSPTVNTPTMTSPVTTGEVVDATAATLAVTAATHAGRIVTLNRAAGVTVTMPAATGTGNRYRFIVGTTVTSNQYRWDVTGDDAMFGNAILFQDAGDTVVGFEAGSDADRINMNGSTTGGIKGATVELVDIAADTWFVFVQSAATGTEATPFLTGQVS